MKRNKIILILLSIIILSVIGCNKVENSNKEKEQNAVKEERKDSIKEQINAMSLDEKIGQLIIVGFEGTDIDENTTSFIKDLKVGGVIFFKRNIEGIRQVVDLNNKLKELNTDNSIPLFISIDEEGGSVSRLSEEFIGLPKAKEIGNFNNKDISFDYGKILGERLKSLGFNLDYAPVMDIISNKSNPVVGDRSFGDSPEIVSTHGLAVKKGIESQNIISSIKHFPGHGDTDIDSHIGLPVINKDLKEIREFELIPFIDGIKDNIDMIMVGHILFPNIDEKYPSTMSKEIITNILREELGFSGVVVSDDLTMGGITKNYSLEEATLKFLQGGGDIGLICHGIDNPKKVIDYLKNAVEQEELSIEDIDDKLYRILRLKEKYNLVDEIVEVPNIDRINKETKDLLNNLN